jgi:hypothetical protein
LTSMVLMCCSFIGFFAPLFFPHSESEFLAWGCVISFVIGFLMCCAGLIRPSRQPWDYRFTTLKTNQ